MDPVAHTLVGAALAETGLKHKTRYATVTLLIGANLPDLDVIATLWGEDTMLFVRRGWSHGVLAMLVLPVLLTAAVWLWHRWRGHLHERPVAFRPATLLLLSFAAVLSHPLLDWLNTYGVRLLMPFDGTWFYGDTLFIMDPWMWLLPLAAVVLARNQIPAVRSGGLVFALLAGIPVLGTDLTGPGVKMLWCLAVAMLLGLAWRFRAATPPGPWLAQLSLATLVIYICATWGLARLAEHAWADPDVLQAQANPLPGSPFAHRLVLVYDDHYGLVTADGEQYQVPRQTPGPVVRAALASPSVRGFVNWMRFPYWEVQESESGWTVTLYDLRYQGPDDPAAGIGKATVKVDKADIE
jgi:inner membrane protein